jgi:REP-associated tyrosine transposase
VNLGGYCYHVLNRANGRLPLFESPGDYEHFLAILAKAHERVAMRTIGFCIMPNHWHLLLRPRGDGDLSQFMRWLTVTHTQRHHAARGTAGTGHIYQGRFKSFPIQRTRPSAAARALGMLEGGDPVLSVLRYIERNPVQAGLATRAAGWAWSSHAMRGAAEPAFPLCDPPNGLPPDWSECVNRPQAQKEVEALQQCIQRGAPFGREPWVRRIAREWGIESTLRPPGRPALLASGRDK